MDAQRAAIKFCIQAKRSAPETLQIIQNASDSHVVSHSSIYQWYTCFSKGREEVKDGQKQPPFQCTHWRRDQGWLSSSHWCLLHLPQIISMFTHWQGYHSYKSGAKL